jgi:DNA-binding GntR family transcriptional regulator
MKMADQQGDEQPQASSRVYLGIMRDLEEGRMVPGQRLAETDLAMRFGVGRNAVREAIQHLAARGVVALSPHRSPMIRTLDLAATMEVLDVASAMTGLAARAAAANFQDSQSELIAGALDLLVNADRYDEPATFSAARRNFYRVLLQLGGNRELQRLFPAIGMHIIYAQHQSRQLRGIRLADYRKIMEAVTARDAYAAERAGHAHVENIRQAILLSEQGRDT